MRNAVWYIALCVISTMLFVYTLWKKKDNKLWALYIFSAGLTYFLEYFVLVIFNSYNYHPNILKNEYFDNVLGSMVSNAFTIPMTCTFVAGLKLSFIKRLFLAAGVLLPSLIDIVLLKADILQMSEKWSLLNFLILRILVLIIIYLFNRYLLSEIHDYKVNA